MSEGRCFVAELTVKHVERTMATSIALKTEIVAQDVFPGDYLKQGDDSRYIKCRKHEAVAVATRSARSNAFTDIAILTTGRNELLQRLQSLEKTADALSAHERADNALLEYINDPEVTDAFYAIKRWYS